jgi:KaiC/GvpD/RAD55 family RecA-like ATPase
MSVVPMHPKKGKAPDENDKRRAGQLSGDPFDGTKPLDQLPPWPTPAQLAATLGHPGPRLQTWIPALDQAWRGGLKQGTRWCIGGAPGAGKTTLATQLAHQWCQDGIPVVYVAGDEPREGILTRIGQRAGLDRTSLEAGTASSRRDLTAHLTGLPLLVLDPDTDEGVTLDNAARWLRTQTDGHAVLILDSIQTLAGYVSPDPRLDVRGQVNALLAEVKRIARVQLVTVVLLSELSRGAYASKASGPYATNDLAAAKESGGIEYSVDVLTVLRNAPDARGAVTFTTPKSRLGRVEPFAMEQSYARAVFEAIDMPEDDQGEDKDPAEAQGQLVAAVLDAIRADPGVRGKAPLSKALKRRVSKINDALIFLEGGGKITNKGTALRPRYYLSV